MEPIGRYIFLLSHQAARETGFWLAAAAFAGALLAATPAAADRCDAIAEPHAFNLCLAGLGPQRATKSKLRAAPPSGSPLSSQMTLRRRKAVAHRSKIDPGAPIEGRRRRWILIPGER